MVEFSFEDRDSPGGPHLASGRFGAVSWTIDGGASVRDSQSALVFAARHRIGRTMTVLCHDMLRRSAQDFIASVTEPSHSQRFLWGLAPRNSARIKVLSEDGAVIEAAVTEAVNSDFVVFVVPLAAEAVPLSAECLDDSGAVLAQVDLDDANVGVDIGRKVVNLDRVPPPPAFAGLWSRVAGGTLPDDLEPASVSYESGPLDWVTAAQRWDLRPLLRPRMPPRSPIRICGRYLRTHIYASAELTIRMTVDGPAVGRSRRDGSATVTQGVWWAVPLGAPEPPNVVVRRRPARLEPHPSARRGPGTSGELSVSWTELCPTLDDSIHGLAVDVRVDPVVWTAEDLLVLADQLVELGE